VAWPPTSATARRIAAAPQSGAAGGATMRPPAQSKNSCDAGEIRATISQPWLGAVEMRHSGREPASVFPPNGLASRIARHTAREAR
jgi:hypothetical protein